MNWPRRADFPDPKWGATGARRREGLGHHSASGDGRIVARMTQNCSHQTLCVGFEQRQCLLRGAVAGCTTKGRLPCGHGTPGIKLGTSHRSGISLGPLTSLYWSNDRTSRACGHCRGLRRFAHGSERCRRRCRSFRREHSAQTGLLSDRIRPIERRTDHRPVHGAVPRQRAQGSGAGNCCAVSHGRGAAGSSNVRHGRAASGSCDIRHGRAGPAAYNRLKRSPGPTGGR
jgi:hypothetical protein